MRLWDSNKKGQVAERAIELAATKVGIDVYRPVGGATRSDMVFDVGGRPLRIQCKWARLSEDGSTLLIHTSGFRLNYSGSVRTPYADGEIDFLIAYAGELDRCFVLPPSIFAGKHQVQLRLRPSRNHQRACINLADDYDFDGAVAQLARAFGWQPKGQGFESPQLHSPATSPDSPPARAVGCEEVYRTWGRLLDEVAAGEEVIVTRRGTPRIRMSPV
jgi:hypothetical protein